MEALAAVALTGNVLQFLDAANRLYSNAKALHHGTTGLTEENEAIDLSARRISELASQLSNKSRNSVQPLSREESQLQDLANECNKHAQYIMNDVASSRLSASSHNKLLQSVRAAAKSMKSRRHIHEKLDRLEIVQRDLNTHILSSIRDQSIEVLATIETLVGQNRTMKGRLEQELAILQQDVVTSENSISQLINNSLAAQTSKVEEAVSAITKSMKEALRYQESLEVLRTLKFDELMRRHDDITDAHSRTLSWVFEKVPHFTTWLSTENGSEPFWIYGVPGSGKSTLMKYLAENRKTREYLDLWAGTYTLVTASFYFWAAGTKMQKSQEGLFRSLLFEIMQKHPEVIHELTSPRTSSPGMSKPVEIRDSIHQWSRSDLIYAMKLLPNIKSGSYRFCFFIDGLDEYLDSAPIENKLSGSRVAEGVDDIIGVMRELNELPNIKLCVSSRPWNAFVAAFGSRSDCKLGVHDLNLDDIRNYVTDAFEAENQGRLDIVSLRELGDQIVAKSEGVFLWVYLVTRSLTRGLRDHLDDLPTLQRRLDLSPITVDGYFQRMLDSVEEVYQEEAAQIYKVILSSEDIVSSDQDLKNNLVIFSGITEIDPLFGFNAPHRPLSVDLWWEKMEQDKKRLTARCQDILKVYVEAYSEQETLPWYRVDYIHRAAREFISSIETQNYLNSKIRRSFDTNSYRIQSYILLAKSVPETNYGELASGSSYGLFMDIGALDAFTVIDNCTTDDNYRTTAYEELWKSYRSRAQKQEMDPQFFLTMMTRDRNVRFLERNLPAVSQQQIELLHTATEDLQVEAATTLMKMGVSPNSGLVPTQSPSKETEDVGSTAWQNLLRDVFERKTQDFNSFCERKPRYLKLIASALSHGADVFVNCNAGTKETSSMPEDLVSVVNILFAPSERAEIQQMIESRRAQTQGSDEKGGRETNQDVAYPTQNTLVKRLFGWKPWSPGK